MQDRILHWLDTHLPGFLLVLFLLRVGFLLMGNIDLVGDESYYWDWSRHPDWCYYSKPPMVAWLIGVFTWLFGDSTAAMRVPAVICGTVFLWYFHATAAAFYGRRVAAFALLLVLATPANVLANLVMTIDPPLYCFWMMTIYYLRRALFDGCPRAWVWAGASTAAGLLSKQVAIALPLMLIVYLLMDAGRRHWLRREFLWYLLPVVVGGLPILLWNADHNWVMFQHSKDHFTGQITATLADSLKNTGELLLYQLLLISPVVFVLLLVCSLQCVWHLRRMSAERQFLVLMGPLLLFGVLLLSLKQKVQGNWPLPFYFTGLILLAGVWQQGRWRKTLNYALGIGYCMVAITYLLPNVLSTFNLQQSRYDLLRRFNYWPQVAAEIQQVRLLQEPAAADSFIVTLGHRNLASQLAFYLPDHPQVFRYEAGGRIKSQYELWPGPLTAHRGSNALVVSDVRDIPAEIRQAFHSLSYLKAIPDPLHRNQSFYLFFGQTLEYWPIAVGKETS